MKLLLAEDELSLSKALVHILEKNHYTVDPVYNGQDALDYLEHGNYDAVILDIMMPTKDGFAVAKEIRRFDKKVPIIFLSAKTLEADKLKGFEIGCDDYITKPFSMEELIARLNATLRRTFDDYKPENNIFSIGNYTFDYNRQLLTINGEDQKLTAKESELLKMYCVNFNQLVERVTTLQKIWKDDSYFAARSMDVYITKLRKYLSKDPDIQLVNMHGIGFKLTSQTPSKK